MANGYPLIPSMLRFTRDGQTGVRGGGQLPPTTASQRQGVPVYDVLPQRVGESVMPTSYLTPQQRQQITGAGLAQQQQQRRQLAPSVFDAMPSAGGMSPRDQAMMSAAATGLQLSGYQDRPITIGQGLGAMAQAGMTAFSEAEEKRREQERLEAEAEAASLQRRQDLYIKFLELQATRGKEGQALKSEILKMEQSHRKEHSDMSKAYFEGNKFYQDVLNYSKPKQTAAADLALVFSFMKMLDPTSVVREGEQAQVINLASIPDVIRKTFTNLGIVEGSTRGELAKSGKIVLPENVREQIRNAADLKYAIIYNDQKRIDDQFVRHGIAGGFRDDYFNPLAFADGSRKKPYVFNTIEELDASKAKVGDFFLLNGELQIVKGRS